MIEPKPPLGRRERSKLRVKNRLYESALELFAEQGYEGTTIDQIAERADVARGTFFNHFQRKEDLVGCWALRREEQLKEWLEKPVESQNDDITVHLERCMATLADFNEADRKLTPVMLSAWVKSGQPLLEEPEYAGRVFAGLIKSAQERGEVAPDIDPTQAGNILRDSYLGILYRWSQGPQRNVPLSVELRAVLRILLTGILSYDQRGWVASPGSDEVDDRR